MLIKFSGCGDGKGKNFILAIALHAYIKGSRPSHQIPNSAIAFLFSNERSTKIKERSPFTANTKHYDRCTECDRPFYQLLRTCAFSSISNPPSPKASPEE